MARSILVEAALDNCDAIGKIVAQLWLSQS